MDKRSTFDKNEHSGGKRSYNGERKHNDRYNGEKKHFDRNNGEKKPYSGEKRRFDGEKKPFERKGDEKRGFDRPRRPFDRDGERKPFERDGERKSFDRNGDRKPFDRENGERKPFREDGGEFRSRRPRPLKERAPRGASPARLAALEALLAVEEDQAYTGLALDGVLKKTQLSDEDRRLCTELFYGSIEKRLYLDYVIAPFVREPFTRADVLEILRMAVYQKLFLDRIPPNAICNEAVELVRSRGLERLCPVINGILRSFMRNGVRELPEDPMERLSIETSTPMWLLESLVGEMGVEGAKEFLSSDGKSGMAVRAGKTKYSNEMLEKWLDASKLEYRKSEYTDAYIISGGAMAQSELFARGQISIIGEASMLACDLLKVKNGARVLDACAAPGGKSCYIGDLLNGTGRVTSCDIHPYRVKLIDAYAKRVGLDNIRPRVLDMTKPRDEMSEYFDYVLVDAPCSGLGVLRNKPDMKYQVSAESLSDLPQVQLSILDTAAKALKNGGTLVYCTCTVLRNENQEVVKQFLESHEDFCADDIKGDLPEKLKEYAQGNSILMLPQRDGTDGFFIARFKKSGRKA